MTQIIFIVVPNNFFNKLKYNIFNKIISKSIIICLKSPQHIVSHYMESYPRVHDSTNKGITIFKMSQLTTCNMLMKSERWIHDIMFGNGVLSYFDFEKVIPIHHNVILTSCLRHEACFDIQHKTIKDTMRRLFFTQFT